MESSLRIVWFTSYRLSGVWSLSQHFQRFEQCVFIYCFIAFDPNFRSFRGTNLNENRYIGAFNLADH